MQWSPGVHPGAWPQYDFSAYQGGYPPVTSMADGATPHNIRDILGAQQQATLTSEVAKTPSSYQKSPTSAGAAAASGAIFQYPPVPGSEVRSPTTPNQEVPPHGTYFIPAVGRPFCKFRPRSACLLSVQFSNVHEHFCLLGKNLYEFTYINSSARVNSLQAANLSTAH